MIYIKWEENRDKFMSHYQKLPRSLKKLWFRFKCGSGKFKIQKIKDIESIVLPDVNDKMLKKLKKLANIHCWKNVCVSDNLRWNSDFMRFAEENHLKIMDGRWLFKNMIEQVFDYVVECRKEISENQEIAILCHTLDETIMEKIKEIASKVKVCNIVTKNSKQFQKLEEEIYQTNGIILNVSNNYKKAMMKSSVVINFDFIQRDLRKCVFGEKACMIDLQANKEMQKKEWEGRNVTFFEVDMPMKYIPYREAMEGFNSSILYESFIYKKTSYRNIKKELWGDDAKILYLIDFNRQVIKKPKVNLEKRLDKITN